MKKDSEIRSSFPYEVQMSASHSFCAEIQKKSNLRKVEKRYRTNIEKIV